MNHCNYCHVDVDPQHSQCPLCGSAVGQVGDSPTAYPHYHMESPKILLLKKILLFATIVTCIISLFINAFTLNLAFSFWSVIVSISLLVTWFTLLLIPSKRLTLGSKLLCLYGIIVILCVTIDACSGFQKWSTTYIIPFLTIGLTLVFTLLAVSKRKRFSEYLGYLLTTFFISFCPLLLFAFSLSNEAWTSLVALLYCIITMIGLVLFADVTFKNEIKKRFHFM